MPNFKQDDHSYELKARRVSLLDCVIGRRLEGKVEKEAYVGISLGRQDGAVELFALPIGDAKFLLYRLALVLRGEPETDHPDRIEQTFRRWSKPHSVLRAESRVHEDGQIYLNELKTLMPELGQYVERELSTIQRSLRASGRSAAKPTTVLARVKRCSRSRSMLLEARLEVRGREEKVTTSSSQ